MKFYVPIIAVLVLITSCKKEQPELTPVNEDCDCASKVSADFEILELEAALGLEPQGMDTDTIFLNANVFFRAKEEGAEYTWYIGSEVLDTKEVGRSFPQQFANQDITVSLVVRKQPNYICYPQDDGYDSISRTFHVQNYTSGALTNEYDNGVTLMEGVFRVKPDNMLDSIDITIDYVDPPPPALPEEQVYITNFDGEGSMLWLPRLNPSRLTYRGFWATDDDAQYNCLVGTFFYHVDGEAEFNYSYCKQENGVSVDYTISAKGRKL